MECFPDAANRQAADFPLPFLGLKEERRFVVGLKLSVLDLRRISGRFAPFRGGGTGCVSTEVQ